MTRSNQLKTKKRKIHIPVLVVVIAAIIIFIQMRGNSSKSAVEEKQQTEEVTVQDLTKSIGATGIIVSKKSRELSVSLTDTEVTKVYAKEGKAVRKGEPLMAFDVSESEKNLSDAKSALSRERQKNSISISDASRSVSYAETTRDQQIASAKKAKENAYSSYKEARKGYKDAKASLKSAKKEETKAKAAYEKTKTQEAKAAYDAATANRSQQEQAVETAKQQKKNAKDTYETQCNMYEQTLAAQEDSVEAAKSKEKSTKLNQDTSTQEAQVRQYQKQVDKGVITAPYDGIITAVNYEKGDIYNGGTALIIQDCSVYEIETQIGEYDISSVEVGQKVLIKTDATGDEKMTGKVASISTTSSSSNSDSSGNMGNSGMASAGSGDCDGE